MLFQKQTIRIHTHNHPAWKLTTAVSDKIQNYYVFMGLSC